MWTALGAYCPAATSPETSLIVANASSPQSLWIANEYLRLRQVPETNLVALDKVQSRGHPSIEDFRRDVLSPVLAHIREHHLEEEIDTIAYSADFPYGVDFSSDIKSHGLPRNRYRGKVAALTGLTYFAKRVEAGDIGYLGRNHYYREFAGPGRALTGIVSGSPQADALKRLRKAASAAMRAKDYATAAGHYREIIERLTDSADYWYDLARAEAGAGRAEQALEALAGAVERGWVHSLRTRRERLFRELSEDSRFEPLLTRMENAHGPFRATRGFRQRHVWSNPDLLSWEPGDELDRYYLSVMLAYTGPRGNSLPEVMDYLARGAASDGTTPDGTVYLMENPDVRSDTRQVLFPVTVAELHAKGRRAEILSRWKGGQDGILPKGRDDVIGVVAGTRGFDWSKSGSTMLPGAIAESLTSYGGHFDKADQTKLSAFLRHGAVGSSGAVAEPYAFQEKFPVPMLHLYYAQGSSMAEAFYQSVAMPYQLLVVGDPLARPFARFAEVGLASPAADQAWSGEVEIEARVAPAVGTSIREVELWIDGQLVGSGRPGEPIRWDTRSVEDGAHELRLVGVEDSAIETRTSFRTVIDVANGQRRVTVEQEAAEVEYGESIVLTGHAPGADTVELRRGHRVLGLADVADGSWRLAGESTAIGPGGATLIVRATYPDGSGVRSGFVPVGVRPPELVPASLDSAPEAPGLSASIEDTTGGRSHAVVKALDGPIRTVPPGQTDAKAKPLSKVRKVALSGYLTIEQPGVYQIGLRSHGQLRMTLGGRPLFDSVEMTPGRQHYALVALEEGWHSVHVEIEPAVDRPMLELVLAGETAPRVMAGKLLRHDSAKGATSAP